MVKKKLMLLDTVSDELKKAIVEKHKPPYSWTTKAIRDWLKESHNIEVSHVTISKWLNRRQATVFKQVYGSKEYKVQVGTEYGLLVAEYFNSVKYIIELMKKVCTSKQVDIIGKTECANKLMTTIKECTLAAKDIVVGKESGESMISDVESEIEKAMSDVPMIRVVREVTGGD